MCRRPRIHDHHLTEIGRSCRRRLPKWGEIVACFFRTDGDQDIDPNILRRHCREHLSPIKTPVVVVWCRVEEFPLTGSGKIQKFVLRDKYLAGDYEW